MSLGSEGVRNVSDVYQDGVWCLEGVWICWRLSDGWLEGVWTVSIFV